MNKSIFNPRFILGRLFLGLGLLFVAFGTSGCFDIEERISLKKDGSGKYTIIMDMSEMGELIASMGGAGGENPLGQMDSAIDETAKRLREAEGISNVVTKSENYVITVSYDFASLEAINKANEDMQGENPMMMQGEGPTYDLNVRKRIFKRVSPDFADLMGDMGAEEENLEMAKMMLGSASYTTVYEMPGRVKKMSNKDAVIGEDKKTVTLNTSFLDLLESKASVGNEISYKRK